MYESPDLPDFQLAQHIWMKNSFEYPAGLWDQLKVEFTFKRSYGFYILQIYLPTYCMVSLRKYGRPSASHGLTFQVFISWIGFWLDHRSLPARVTLGVSSMMALVLQYSNVGRNLPKVSYIKGLDVYMFACIASIFFSLVEVAIAGYMERVNMRRHQTDRKSRMGRRQTLRPFTPAPVSLVDPVDTTCVWMQRNRVNSPVNQPPTCNGSATQASTSGAASMTDVRVKVLSPHPSVDSVHEEARETVFFKRKSIFKEYFNKHKTSVPFAFGSRDDLSNVGRRNRFQSCARWKGDDIDQISQKLFPFVFFILNVGYWWYYTSVAAET